MEDEIERFVARARRRRHLADGLLGRLRRSGRRRRRPPAPAPRAGASRQRRQRRPSPPRPSPAPPRAPPPARRSRRSRRRPPRPAPACARARRSSARQLRIALAREDQRQRDRAVEQVGAAVLAGALGRARDVEHVVEQLEGEPDPAAEVARAAVRVAAALERAQPARGLEQPRGLEVAARAGSARAGRSTSQASARCSSSPAASAERRVGEHAHLVGAAVARPARRTRARTAGRRWRSRSRGRRWPRPSAARAAARRRRARRRGRASPSGSSSTATAARSTPVVAGAGSPAGEEHEQRPQPLAAGGDRRAGVLGEHRAVRRPRAPRAAPRAASISAGTCAPPASTTAATASAAAISATVPDVQGDDPARGEDPADVAQPGGGHAPRPAPPGPGKRLHRARQVACRPPGRRRARPSSGTTRSNQSEKNVDSGGFVRRRDLEHDDAAARAHDARHLGQPAVEVGEVARAEADRRGVEARRPRRAASSALPHSQRSAGRLARGRASSIPSEKSEPDHLAARRRRGAPARSPGRRCRWRRRARGRPGPTRARGRPRARASGGAARPS